ncbi:MAG: AlkZ family DNA glycosylase [Bacteroidales bacterium]|nr:AlkZ family DNA glycosylase [Bacteroidales bacterium]
MNPVAIRLLNQQLASPQFTDPAEVVSHMCAIQAQEYRMMRWAVAMRTKKPSSKAFKQAFDSGKIIRLHLMRGTWQLVSAEDYWWMLDLCAPKSIAVTKGWMSSNKISIPDKELVKIRDILTRYASDKGSATKEDFKQALKEKDIAIDEHRLSYHIRMAEFCGVLCSGDLLPMKATYALSEEKIKSKSSRTDRDESLKLFTRKYFQSRQPATLEDFVWWSGLNVSDCRRGIELLKDFIYKEHWNGRDFFLTDDCRTKGFRKGKYLLIPPYDEYLIGYKSRDIVLPQEYRHKAHNNSGIFQPIIAHNGIICGNWQPFKPGNQAEFFLSDHNDNNDGNNKDKESLQQAWESYNRFLILQ